MKNKLLLSFALLISSIIHAPYAELTYDEGRKIHNSLFNACPLFEKNQGTGAELRGDRKDFIEQLAISSRILQKIRDKNAEIENPEEKFWIHPRIIRGNVRTIDMLRRFLSDKSPKPVRHQDSDRFVRDILELMSEEDKHNMMRGYELLDSLKSGKKPIQKTELHEFFTLLSRFDAGDFVFRILCDLSISVNGSLLDGDKQAGEIFDFILKESSDFSKAQNKALTDILCRINPEKQDSIFEDCPEGLEEFRMIAKMIQHQLKLSLFEHFLDVLEEYQAMNTMDHYKFSLFANLFAKWCDYHAESLDESIKKQKTNKITRFTRSFGLVLYSLYDPGRSFLNIDDALKFHFWIAKIKAIPSSTPEPEPIPQPIPQRFYPPGLVNRRAFVMERPSGSQDPPVLILIPIHGESDEDVEAPQPNHDGNLPDNTETLSMALFHEINATIQRAIKCCASLAKTLFDKHSSQQSIHAHKDGIEECARVLTELRSQITNTEPYKVNLQEMMKDLPFEIVLLIPGDYPHALKCASRIYDEDNDEEMANCLSQLSEIMAQFIKKDDFNVIGFCAGIFGAIQKKDDQHLFDYVDGLMRHLEPFQLKGIEFRLFKREIIIRLARWQDFPEFVSNKYTRVIPGLLRFMLLAQSLSNSNIASVHPHIFSVLDTAWKKSEVLRQELLNVIQQSPQDQVQKVYSLLGSATISTGNSEFLQSLRAGRIVQNAPQVPQVHPGFLYATYFQQLRPQGPFVFVPHCVQPIPAQRP